MRESGPALALAALLFWAPIPAGSVIPWAELLFRLGAIGLFLWAGWPFARRWLHSGALPVAALAAVALLGLAQSCPWPGAVAAVVSPEHARLRAETGDLVAGAARAHPVRLSLDAAASRSSAVSWLVAAALLAAALVVGRRRRHRRWLLAAMVLAALAQLGYGWIALQSAARGGPSMALHPAGRLAGTYANFNHLSLLFEMTMAAAGAWSWLELTRDGRPGGRRLLRVLAPLGVWLLLLAGVVLTGSRAGLAAAGLGCAVQIGYLLLTRRGRGSRLTALVLLLALAALLVLGSRFEIGRYQEVSLFEDNLRGRLLGVSPALELWRRFPVTGTGLGTFEDAFPMVAPPEMSRVTWNRAHNDPLELLVTGGAAGLALAMLAVTALLPPVVRALRRGPTAEDRAAGLAALGALAAVGLHELLDFGLVIPANHLTLLVILGSAAAAGLSRPTTPARGAGLPGTAAVR